MKLHQLRFDDPVQEKRYQDFIEGSLIIQMRLGLLAPALLYLLYGMLLDAYILPGASHFVVSAIHVSQGVFLLTLVLSFLYFRTLRYHRIMVVFGVMVAWTNHLIVL
ncbi:MAG TPA: hypothetical protein VJ998_10520, partial [Pseudomonadales bacterium]|nr:hypothetical protein [Pseudomonadales bacterium]